MRANTFLHRLVIMVLTMVFATIVINDLGSRNAQVVAPPMGGDSSASTGWIAQYCCINFCYIPNSLEEGCNRLDASNCEAFFEPPEEDTTCRQTYCNNWYFYQDPTLNLASCNSFCGQYPDGETCDAGTDGGIGGIGGSSASSAVASSEDSESSQEDSSVASSGASSNNSSAAESSSASSVPVTCGNGILQSGEICDGQQGLYNCPSRACSGSCTCRPLSSSSRASSAPSSSASQDSASSLASSASSTSLIPDPECPLGHTRVYVRPELQYGLNYVHVLPAGRYKVEVLSPEGIPDGDYANHAWANTATDATSTFHGSSLFIVRGMDPIFGADTDPISKPLGGTRVTNASVYLDSDRFAPPYNQSRRRAADAARNESALLNLGVGDRLVFVVNDLVGGTGKSTYTDNRGRLEIRLCAQTLFAVSSSAVPSSVTSSATSSVSSAVSSSRPPSSASSAAPSSVISVVSVASVASSTPSSFSAVSASAVSSSATSFVSEAPVALAPDCGNGTVEEGEFCDDGNASNMDACTNACRLASCGDGIVQQPESCDEGVYNSDEFPDTCRTGCVLPGCGDGVLDGGEDCDDGNRIGTDDCPNTCLRTVDCGNGIREGREWCDDGNDDPYDGCMPSCLWSMDVPCNNDGQCDSGHCDGVCTARAVCGDGVRQGDEACDQGTANSNTIPNRCRLSCRLASVGDGVIDNREECDDGNVFDGDGCDVRGRNELVAGLIDEQPAVPAAAPAISYVLPAAALSPPVPVITGVIQASHAGAMSNPNTGPAALALMASGAAAGFAWIRRRRS